jgi:hypothetical protein
MAQTKCNSDAYKRLQYRRLLQNSPSSFYQTGKAVTEKCIETAKAFIFSSSGEGLQPRPFVQFGRVSVPFLYEYGTRAFVNFRVTAS